VKEFLTAIISAVTSVVVVLVTYGLNSYRETKSKEKQEADRILLTYLNPLRFYLVENYFRFSEILQRIVKDGGRHEALLDLLQINFRLVNQAA
jgi:hypothetical protein